jgi:hypothetical protein
MVLDCRQDEISTSSMGPSRSSFHAAVPFGRFDGTAFEAAIRLRANCRTMHCQRTKISRSKPSWRPSEPGSTQAYPVTCWFLGGGSTESNSGGGGESKGRKDGIQKTASARRQGAKLDLQATVHADLTLTTHIRDSRDESDRAATVFNAKTTMAFGQTGRVQGLLSGLLWRLVSTSESGDPTPGEELGERLLVRWVASAIDRQTETSL